MLGLAGLPLSVCSGMLPARAAEPPVHRVKNRRSNRRQKHHVHLDRQRTRQRRRTDRKQEKNPGAQWLTKGLSIDFKNPESARSTPHIEVVRYDCDIVGVEPSCACEAKAVFDMLPGQTPQNFDADLDHTAVQVTRKYTILFANPIFQRPFIKGLIANDDALCHYTKSTLVLDNYHFDEGERFTFALNGRLFTVTRHADKPDFKYFTLELPNDL